MRRAALAILCTLALAPLSATAQDGQRIKASGANAAGVCAGALDMLGQYLSRADSPDPAKLGQVQQARDFFADTPRFPASEVAAAATAFIQFMGGRIRSAATDADRQAVQRELVDLATRCGNTYASASQAQPPAGGAVAPPVTVLPAQPVPVQPSYSLDPLPVQPIPTQPLPAQPYDTQPLVLDPVTPAQ